MIRVLGRHQVGSINQMKCHSSMPNFFFTLSSLKPDCWNKNRISKAALAGFFVIFEVRFCRSHEIRTRRKNLEKNQALALALALALFLCFFFLP